MIEAILFLILAVLLIVLLAFLLQRIAAPVRELGELPKYDEVPRELADRLFGSDDWEFIVAHGSDRLKGEFLRERKILALSWLRSVRASTNMLMEAHRASARASSQLDAFVELKLAVTVLRLRFFCRFLAFVILLRGPVGMQDLIARLDALSERVLQGHIQFSADSNR